MLIEEWKYENMLYRCVDDDKFYCPILRREVDLGWDFLESTVHDWIGSLNIIASKIYKQVGKGPREIRINKNTFDLIELKANYYYKDGKLNHYVVKVLENIEDNEIQVCIGGNVEGKINILNN